MLSKTHFEQSQISQDMLYQLEGMAWSKRLSVAKVMKHHSGEAAFQLLLQLLKDRQWLIRAAAAESLGALKAEASARPLLEAVQQDPNPLVRSHATEALKAMGRESEVSALLIDRIFSRREQSPV